MSLARLLADRPHVLVDFDGPVCSVFGALPAADVAACIVRALREHGVHVPEHIATTTDPFDLLYAAADEAPEYAALAESELRALEVEAVTTAPITPGAVDALAALKERDFNVLVVSNNSTAAVEAFIGARALYPYLRGVVARTDPDPALLKPNPHLVYLAAATLGVAAELTVLIGDSTTDIIAAHAARARAIAYANKPGKREAFAPLRPEATIDNMETVARAVRALSTHA